MLFMNYPIWGRQRPLLCELSEHEFVCMSAAHCVCFVLNRQNFLKRKEKENFWLFFLAPVFCVFLGSIFSHLLVIVFILYCLLSIFSFVGIFPVFI